jgi:hypothetical protein
MADRLLHCQAGQPEFLPSGHEPNSILMVWLLILLALVIERLYRLRYLHRRDHDIRNAMDLFTFLWLSLGSRTPPDSA